VREKSFQHEVDSEDRNFCMHVEYVSVATNLVHAQLFHTTPLHLADNYV